MEVIEELYPVLLQRAVEITAGALRNTNRSMKMEVAHDITVDFLFFSNSYKDTYDHSKDIKPFFASYVGRKLRRFWDDQNFYQNRIIAGDKVMEKIPHDDQMEEWLELRSRLEFFYEYLREFHWKTINLGKLFIVIVKLRLLEGRETYRELSKQLSGARYIIIKEAKLEMQRLIDKKKADGY